jgi:hypothetical protein
MSEAGNEQTAANDVEAHGMHWSDETLKQKIAELEDTLDSLRRLETQPQEGEEADVEAHGMHWSDEILKQTIAKVENALEVLKKIQAGAKSS